MHEIRFSAGAPPRTPLGELTTLSSPPNRLGRGKPPPHSSPPQCLWCLRLVAPANWGGVSILQGEWKALRVPIFRYCGYTVRRNNHHDMRKAQQSSELKACRSVILYFFYFL